MKNTLENKAKFFALYFGQRIMKKNIEGLENFITEPDGFLRSPSKETYLELKSLSSISDEDAIEVAKLNVYRYSDGRRSTYYEHYLNVMGENPVEYVKSILINTIHWDELSLKCYDFLRSKGYALPYMGLSVEELVNRGWIKLKGETK